MKSLNTINCKVGEKSIMIKVNGIEREWRKNLTIDFLLKSEPKHTFPLIIVKINGKYVPKEEYKNTLIRDHDNIQVIHSIAGG